MSYFFTFYRNYIKAYDNEGIQCLLNTLIAHYRFLMKEKYIILDHSGKIIGILRDINWVLLG